MLLLRWHLGPQGAGGLHGARGRALNLSFHAAMQDADSTPHSPSDSLFLQLLHARTAPHMRPA